MTWQSYFLSNCILTPCLSYRVTSEQNYGGVVWGRKRGVGYVNGRGGWGWGEWGRVGGEGHGSSCGE